MQNVIAVGVFNIDKFKNINDYFGSGVGDKVLQYMALNLDLFFSKLNLKVYRVGADDFAVIFREISKEKVLEIAKEALDFLETQKVLINDTLMNISMSVGISYEPPYLEKADIALKNIKKDITQKIGVYSDEMQIQIKENIKKSKEIKDAINENKLVAYYQPIFDREKNIVKYEVLCRVKVDGEIKSIYPYLKILKEIRMYHKLTEFILKESYWVLIRNPNVNLSINLSIEDLMNDEINKILNDLYLSDISDRVTFEILESEIENYDLIEKFINKFKHYGIKFAIDDFGSGYSNFIYLAKLDPEFLKIDGSIIKNLHEDKNLYIITKHINAFAKEIGCKTIAEFVSNEDIYKKVVEIGVDGVQGYFIEEPKEMK
jgi:diguanylate cyclase (GGDEF)-like protein